MHIPSHLLLSVVGAAFSNAWPRPSPDSLFPNLKPRGLPDFFMGPDHPLMLARRNESLAKRQTDFVQDYRNGGRVDFEYQSGSFSVDYDTGEGFNNFVVGIGWNPGGNIPVSHSGTFEVDRGVGTLSLYGWSRDPLVEYYVFEEQNGFTFSGENRGSFYSDGALYNIILGQRDNQPSIEGTASFPQFVSARASSTTSGTITIANHFAAWEAAGMHLGTLDLQAIVIESWDGAGRGQQAVSRQA